MFVGKCSFCSLQSAFPAMSLLQSFLLLSIALFINDGIAFSRAFYHPQRCSNAFLYRKHIFSSKIDTEEKSDDADESTSSSSMMTLNFLGETEITSQMAPSSTNKSLRGFFSLPQSASLLLKGARNNELNELENIDADLLKQYKIMCGRVDASPPSSNERIFDVTTPGVKFPGLQVLSVATIGVNIVNEGGLPSYEFVLIRDSTYAKGNRLFVWFFNKITGKDKEDNAKTDQTTFSLTKIRVVQEGNGIAFQSIANLGIQIRFPAFLMKAIPGASQEKFESQGGVSLRKALEDDIPDALALFREEYIQWLETES